MELDSARSLKQELLGQLVLPVSRAGHPGRARARSAGVSAEARSMAAASPFAVAATPLGKVPDVQRSVALGVARKGKQYRLAVRVQRQALMASPLVEQIVSQAKGEADVRMVGRVEKRTGPWHRENTRPLLIGASIGHVDVTAGTLGLFVRRAKRLLILSNNHVLANEDLADEGDEIVQRGMIDGGRVPRDVIGALRFAVKFKKNGINFVDAALADINDGIAHDPTLLRGLVGGTDRLLAGLGPDFLDEGETVHKVGRTTGATEGRVSAFDLDNVVISYDIGNVRFDGQVEIEGVGSQPFSDGGDSGSGIVNADMQAVALLFAGSDTGGTNGLGLTYANPIHKVLGDLKAELVTS